ncbi:C1QL [Mytilus coruscus]|uniref:C1QL n=1 Tax=Mytilus coruscus TaxID=42192 RepID=A0A6J8BK71_MYTCO|nr:C1QL [Mytilus coruscus]
MKVMLESLSLNIQEFGVAEKKRGTSLELMQNTLNSKFNQSFDLILENFRIANETVHEVIITQQKDFEALLKTRHIVAFSAYRISQQKLTSPHENFKFDNVWTNIGNGYDPSTGIFTAPHQGVYHFSAVAVSVNGKTLYLKLVHNNKSTSGSWVTGLGYKTGTMDVIFNLQKGDKMSVGATGGYALYSDINKYATFSGYLIV